MDSSSLMDWILGGLAFIILLSGLWMLFSGLQGTGDKF